MAGSSEYKAGDRVWWMGVYGTVHTGIVQERSGAWTLIQEDGRKGMTTSVAPWECYTSEQDCISENAHREVMKPEDMGIDSLVAYIRQHDADKKKPEAVDKAKKRLAGLLGLVPATEREYNG